jgi:hypothetical protein
MIKLTRTEIRWMLNMVITDRDNSKALKDCPGQVYAALHKLEYENMAALAEKLEKVLELGAKRIAID